MSTFILFLLFDGDEVSMGSQKNKQHHKLKDMHLMHHTCTLMSRWCLCFCEATAIYSLWWDEIAREVKEEQPDDNKRVVDELCPGDCGRWSQKGKRQWSEYQQLNNANGIWQAQIWIPTTRSGDRGSKININRMATPQACELALHLLKHDFGTAVEVRERFDWDHKRHSSVLYPKVSSESAIHK